MWILLESRKTPLERVPAGFFFFSPSPPNTLTPNSLAPNSLIPNSLPRTLSPGNSRSILVR